MSAAVRALVGRQARAWEAGDPEAIVADYAPDGELVSPGGRWRGHAALREAVAAFFAGVSDVRVEVTRIVVEGEEGAVEWTWSETSRATGTRTTMQDGIVFALRDGKITYWREYFDPAGARAEPA